MFRWLAILMGMAEPPCNHMWKQTDKIPVYDETGTSRIRLIYILRCELCGDIKDHRING